MDNADDPQSNEASPSEAVERLPGFLGWVNEGARPPPGTRCTIGSWGLRRSAAFDRDLTGAEPELVTEMERVLTLLGAIPREYDPIHEVRIARVPYWLVVVDGLCFRNIPEAAREEAHRILDPSGDMGGVGLENMLVSRIRVAFDSRSAAESLVHELVPLGVSCELREQEAFLHSGALLIEDSRKVDAEAQRRQAAGENIPVGNAAEWPVELLFSGFDP